MDTIKNNGCFSGNERHCKWCNWKRTCVKRHSICWHMMTTDSSAVSRAILLELCAELRPALERNTARSHALLVPQVMCTLGLKATGAFERELANRLGLCQSTLSRAMPAEWDGIICISAGISNSHNAGQQAIGAIDCTQRYKSAIT